jgi:hypothetical protein
MTPDDLIFRMLISNSVIMLVIITAVGASVSGYARRFQKRAQHTSCLSGERWVQELLHGHESRIYNKLGMHRAVFIQLREVLRRKAGLNDTRYVSADEQLAIFLHYIRRGLPNRGLQERFQRSADTVSKCVLLY